MSTSVEFYNITSTTSYSAELNDINGVTNENHSQKAQSALLFYTVFSVMFFTGIVGNGLLIFIFCRHKKMRTPANTCIVNLSLANLITILNCALIPVMGKIVQTYPIICKLSQTIMECSMGVTSLTLIALSVERYYAVVHPFQRRLSSQRTTHLVVFITWVISLTYNLTKIFVLSHKKPEIFTRVQMFNPNTYMVTDFFFLYLIPLIIIAYCYILMAYRLYFGVNSISKGSSSSSTKSHRFGARKRIAVAVLILVAMFAFFHLPTTVISLKLYYYGNSEQTSKWDSWIMILLCIGCLHNALNPIIMYVLSTPYRVHFNNYLMCSILETPVLVEDGSTDPYDYKTTNTTGPSISSP